MTKHINFELLVLRNEVKLVKELNTLLFDEIEQCFGSLDGLVFKQLPNFSSYMNDTDVLVKAKVYNPSLSTEEHIKLAEVRRRDLVVTI